MVKFLLLFGGTLFVASIIGYITLKSVTIEQHKKHLQNSISLIELKNVENLQEYVKKVAQSTELRVRITSEDGSLLAGSKVLKSDFLDVAKKVSYKDEFIYIKLYTSLDAIMDEFYFLFLQLFFLFLIVFILAFYISKKISEKILLDIADIRNYLEEISKKNYSAVIKTRYFYEFLQISLKLKNIVKRLHSKDKQKRKNNKLS